MAKCSCIVALQGVHLWATLTGKLKATTNRKDECVVDPSHGLQSLLSSLCIITSRAHTQHHQAMGCICLCHRALKQSRTLVRWWLLESDLWVMSQRLCPCFRQSIAKSHRFKFCWSERLRVWLLFERQSYMSSPDLWLHLLTSTDVSIRKWMTEAEG